MAKFRCINCGHIYDEDEGDLYLGIKPGTPFSDLPLNWSCPLCGTRTDKYEELPDQNELLKKFYLGLGKNLQGKKTSV